MFLSVGLYLRYKDSYWHLKSSLEEDSYFPLINGRNIYDNLTGFWIKKSDVSRLRGYFKIPHIVVWHGFRENGKIGAAYDKRCYRWMGDVYNLLP